MHCLDCHGATAVAEIGRGRAGASALREYERRRRNRESRTRAAHPIIGGALVALRAAPPQERAFERGAEGERAVAESLGRLLSGGDTAILHDRRMPGGRGNIDHLAVAPSGVYVIDAKAWHGKVKVSTPLIGRPKLLIDGRDRTSLIDGLDRQVAAVREGIGTADVPIQGVLCFTKADLPLIGTTRMRGHLLLYRKALAKRLEAAGAMDPEAIGSLARRLSGAFPAA